MVTVGSLILTKKYREIPREISREVSREIYREISLETRKRSKLPFLIILEVYKKTLHVFITGCSKEKFKIDPIYFFCMKNSLGINSILVAYPLISN